MTGLTLPKLGAPLPKLGALPRKDLPMRKPGTGQPKLARMSLLGALKG